MERYDPKTIEPKWQQVWEVERIFETPNPPADATTQEPHWYQLEMLPYPSGTLHMGHVLNYTMGDVVTHFRRRKGWTVLRPMGFDSFGLPAENAAIQEGGHPREITERNIAAIRVQMKRLGWAIDWAREISAHEIEYYRWTQWLFLRFFERGLAYRAAAPVNWCPYDQTVVANEYVVDGRCDRCGTLVEARMMEQWFFKITAYADELLEYDLPEWGEWPERTKTIQRNWIGRSEGAEILFPIEELDEDVPVFTTRPDTLFGATFFVLAPEHPLVERIESDEVQDYAKRTAARRGELRAAEEVKTGVFTGLYATNPVNGERLPVWVADYVLMEYGTGAIMAVPAHDERDREFAETFALPIQHVIDEEDGVLINSGEFTGLPVEEGKRRIVEWLAARGMGRPAVSFRLRDWSFSRQRYWGCPIPIVYCDDCGMVAVPDEDLPVVLPEVADYRPKGVPPLASNEEWLHVPCPKCGKDARREADTMDTFVDSSWYFLRYVDPRNDQAPFDRRLVDYWCPVTQYIGGIDHATGHLLYSRFFIRVMREMELVDFGEPFGRLFHQGWIQMGGSKMSKSRGNVAGPDALVDEYGADAVRTYILFMGPADQDMEWNDAGIEGVVRFLRRLWRLVIEVAEQPTAPSNHVETQDSTLLRKAHTTIAKATDDIDRRFQFHTPIAAVMELTNELARAPDDPAARFAAETAVSLIQPYAPHLAEELWERLGHERLWAEPWPEADPALLEKGTFELVVQVNGRVRDRMEVPSDLAEDELIERAKASPRVQSFLDGGEIRQTIVVPRKLVNIVTQ
jgi:leucyl-tRNA synthetase